MEILNLNCISINDKMYEIDPNNEDEKPYIKVFYTDADDIIIAGMIAYHGVYWLSVTDIKETDTIRKIFAYVSALIPTKCANIHAVIGNTYYNDEQLKLFPYNFPAAADEIFSHYLRIKDSFSLSGAFEKYKDILKYNFLVPAKPKYMPNPAHRCIQVYYANDNEIMILGVADTCYLYWLSITKMDDIETNRLIVEYISMIEPTVFGSWGFTVDKTKYTYDQFRSFYYTTITCVEDIETHYRRAKNRSGKSNTKDNQLISKLQKYLAVMSQCNDNPMDFYNSHSEMFRDIWSMKHLRCSDNPKLRNLFHQVEQRASNIYNAYMTEAH